MTLPCVTYDNVYIFTCMPNVIAKCSYNNDSFSVSLISLRHRSVIDNFDQGLSWVLGSKSQIRRGQSCLGPVSGHILMDQVRLGREKLTHVHLCSTPG